VICEIAARLVALVPWRWLRAGGTAIGWLAGSVLRIRRAHVEAAMHRAGIEPAGRLASRMYVSLGTALLEFLWMAGRPRRAIDPVVTFSPDATALWDRPRRAGQGRIVVTAHTGNWEIVGCAAAARMSTSLTVVTKHLHVRGLDRFWQKTRADRGERFLDADGVYARAAAILRQGGDVAIVVDQAPERASSVVRLDFLGGLAGYDLLAAILSARTGAPIVMALGRRTGSGTHVVEIPLAIDPPERPRAQFVREATGRINRALDVFVRAHPDQWLWMHRRWKPVAGDGSAQAESPGLPRRAPAW
jgi:Kdo2-lipid IVA lauroyltransferase/acyltransferase